LSFRRLLAIVVKELRQLRRDRLTFAMIIGIPTMQLVLFGYAINLDVRHLEAAVLDEADTAESRELIAGLEATEVLDLKFRAASAEEIEDLLQRGTISAAIVIPSDFAHRLQGRDHPPVQIIVDGSDQVIQAAARQLAAFPVPYRLDWLSMTGSIEVVNYYNPERRAAINTVPGLIGVI
jgi:ABC-2 type transport system permease protein